MSKYAVYVLIVEDTEQNDMDIAMLYPETMERAAGNLDDIEAGEAYGAAVQAAESYDKGIDR